MRYLKGYLESGVFTVGNMKESPTPGRSVISHETMERDGFSNMFEELPVVFHESAP